MQIRGDRGCTGRKPFYPDHLNLVLILFCSLSFLGYGATSFLSASMKREFERYRFGSQRGMIGSLQVAASIGLLAGLSQPWMGRLAAAGLALMMLVAVSSQTLRIPPATTRCRTTERYSMVVKEGSQRTGLSGADYRTRTDDLLITNQLLYQLS